MAIREVKSRDFASSPWQLHPCGDLLQCLANGPENTISKGDETQRLLPVAAMRFNPCLKRLASTLATRAASLADELIRAMVQKS